MQRAKKPSKRKSTATRKKLTCEALEDRRVLATVTLNTDTGAAGELRTELAGAAPGEVIDFNLPAGNETIVLSGELVLDKDISIDGLNSAGSGVSVTLDAAGTSRVLNVDDGDDANSLSVSLSNLTITGGDTSTQPLDVVDGGGIRNFESLSITDSVITGNSSADDGGGIFSNGTLAISGTSIDANTAEDRAAGLFGYGEISITDNSSISGNMIVSDGDALGVGALFGAGSVTTIDGATINNNIGESTYYDPVSMTEDDGRGSGIYVSGFGDAIPTSLTITNSTFDGNTTDGQGGAIQAGIAVTLTIEDSTFTNNTAGGDAGAIGTSSFGVDSGAVTTIRRTTISGNSAGDDAGGIEPTGGVALYLEDSLLENNYAYDRGGAIYARGQDAVLDSTIVITGTTFIGNRAIDDGGGLHASPNVQLTVDDSDFMGNTAVSRGAAIRFSFADDPGEGSVGLITNSRITGNMTDDDGGAGYVGQGFDATFENATIENNESLDGGAGLRAQAGGIITVNDSSVSNNISGGFGGGFHNISGSLITINNSTVAGNSAVGGGGAMDATNAATSINNSTISGNTTDGLGAGLYFELDPAAPTLYEQSVNSSTVTGNASMNYGGGIYVGYYASPAITGSIVSGNTATVVANDIYETRGTFSVAFTLVGDNSGSTLVESALDANGNIIGGPTNGTVDAMLGPLQNNGGPTLTHAPMSGSPVIEAGDPSIMGGVDQRGFDRVFDGINLMAGGIVDMGSVEYGSGGSAPTVDFDGDGNANCNDIDALHAVIVAGSNDPAFDLTGDGNVDINDQSQWLADAAVFNGFATPYQQADFNLDRVVDVSDFGIWNSAKFTTNSAFCSGDANADGVVDVSDFGIWNAAKFTSADSAARGDASATLTREDVRSMRAQLNDADESADPIDDFQMAGDNDRVAARVVQQSIAIADQPLESQTVATSNLVDFEANIVNVPAVDFDILVVHDQEDAADDRLRVATVNEIFAEEVEWL